MTLADAIARNRAREAERPEISDAEADAFCVAFLALSGAGMPRESGRECLRHGKTPATAWAEVQELRASGRLRNADVGGA